MLAFVFQGRGVGKGRGILQPVRNRQAFLADIKGWAAHNRPFFMCTRRLRHNKYILTQQGNYTTHPSIS